MDSLENRYLKSINFPGYKKDLLRFNKVSMAGDEYGMPLYALDIDYLIEFLDKAKYINEK